VRPEGEKAFLLQRALAAGESRRSIAKTMAVHQATSRASRYRCSSFYCSALDCAFKPWWSGTVNVTVGLPREDLMVGVDQLDLYFVLAGWQPGDVDGIEITRVM
jgi:hypothetical protein